MGKKKELERISKKLLELLKKEKEVIQADLTKLLEASSRDISRVVIDLEKSGAIKRVETRVRNRKTYKIVLVEGAKKSPAKEKKEAKESERPEVNYGVLLGIPCLVCQDLDKCGPGHTVDPATCVKLSMWLYRVSGGVRTYESAVV